MTSGLQRIGPLGAVLVALITMLSMTVLAQESARQLFERARLLEGNRQGLDEALKLYEQVVAQAKADRPLAASALLHVGGCYEKLGDPRATQIYRQVVNDYADQVDIVAVALARLTAQEPTGVANRPVWPVTTTMPYFWGHVSPDGRFLAYASQADQDIYLHEIATGVDRRLTHAAKPGTPPARDDRERFGDAISSFSRDGRQVAYSWRVGDGRSSHEELRIINFAGPSIPEPRVLLNATDIVFVGAFDWSPDGNSIAVGVWRVKNGGAELGLLSLKDGAIRPLRHLGDASGDALGNVLFSPDGKYLAYNPDRKFGDSDRDIFIIDLETNQEQPLMTPPKSDRLIGWSPDGGIVFTSDRSGKSALWLAPFKAGVVGSPRPLDITPLGYSDTTWWNLGMTAAGALYYRIFPASLTDVKTAMVDFTTGLLSSAPAGAAPDFVGANSQPALSRDGTRIAYVSTRAGHDVIVVRSFEIGDARDLSTNLAQVASLAWSPDGIALACEGNLDGTRGLFRIDARTGEATPIGHSGGIFREWSSDSTKVYSERQIENGVEGVFEVDLASGQEREIHRGAIGAISRLAFSADGRTLYYRSPVAVATPPHDLIAKDLVTGKEAILVGQRRLGGLFMSPNGRFIMVPAPDPATNEPTLLLVPTDGSPTKEFARGFGFTIWSPDGRSIIASKPGGTAGAPRTAYWWIPLDGGQPRQLELPDNGRTMSRISARGKRLMFEESDLAPGPDAAGISQVWVLERFLPKSATGRGPGG